MREYRRQIAYIYAYEQGAKMQSAGFVKAEERGGRCRLAVHLRSYGQGKESPGKVYIYFYIQNRTVGIFLGELQSRNGALEWRGEVSADDILDKGIRFSQTRGIWIRRGGQQDYVAEWDDYPVDVSRFVLYPGRGLKCIRCPKFGNCERSSTDEADRRGTVYEGGHPSG